MPKAKKKVTKKKVVQKPVHVVYVLDETGSMQFVKNATISGFNEYLKTLQDHPEAASNKFSFITFNTDNIKRRNVLENLSDVKSLSNSTYSPRANTPLYDAIGEGIEDAKEKKEYDVLFVIHTDGEENSSRRETRDSIFNKIEECKKMGWTFVFLGADQDAWLAAEKIGISRGSTISYDNTSKGTMGSYKFGIGTTNRYLNSSTAERINTIEAAVTGDKHKGLDLRKGR